MLSKQGVTTVVKECTFIYISFFSGPHFDQPLYLFCFRVSDCIAASNVAVIREINTVVKVSKIKKIRVSPFLCTIVVAVKVSETHFFY
jgi:hypothetical protein